MAAGPWSPSKCERLDEKKTLGTEEGSRGRTNRAGHVAGSGRAEVSRRQGEEEERESAGLWISSRRVRSLREKADDIVPEISDGRGERRDDWRRGELSDWVF